jgi:hypothetical protein
MIDMREHTARLLRARDHLRWRFQKDRSLSKRETRALTEELADIEQELRAIGKRSEHDLLTK